MKTFNKRGDGGETSLLYGVRTLKSDPRCEAYGTIDEVVSFLGISKNFCRPEVRDILTEVQRDLFVIGAELATPRERYEHLAARGKTVRPEMVEKLEALIDRFEAKVEMPREFIIPGANISSALLDVTRAIARRAERRVVTLKQQGQIQNETVLAYLNRLADLIFTLARYQEQTADGNNPCR
jgi:cob(I)alamin adenosyltransferase